MKIWQVTSDRSDVVGESILWSPEESCLWWIDIPAKTLRSFTPSTGEAKRIALPAIPGFVALGPVGTLVIGLEQEIAIIEIATETITRSIRLPNVPDGSRTNDCVVTRNGELFFGTMPVGDRSKRQGDFRHLGRPGEAIESGIYVPNGLAVSPDGLTLYFADTFPEVQSVWTRSFDPATGKLGEKTDFFAMFDYPGRPDGATVDAEGGYWIAAVTAGELMRVSPDGTCDRRVPLPASHPTKICFGGPGYGTAFVTTIGGAHPQIAAEGEMSGAVIAVETGVTGLAEPRVNFRI